MTVWIIAALLLRACLAATHPFYEPRDLVADDRVVGTYADASTGTTITITKTSMRGRYRATLQEDGSRSRYAVVLFKVGKRTFADITADGPPVVRPAGGALGPATEILQKATGGGRHVAVPVTPDRDGLSVWVAMPDSLSALWQKEPALRRTTVDETLPVVTEATPVLRRLLERHGQDNLLFVQEYWLAKTHR